MRVYKFYEIHEGQPMFVGQSSKEGQLQKFTDKKLPEGVFKAVVEKRK